MTDLLRWWMGLNTKTDWSAISEWRLEFQSLPTGFGWALALLGVLAAFVGIFWLYRKEGRDLPAKVRWPLAGLRLLVLAGACLMLFELVLVAVRKEYIPSSAHPRRFVPEHGIEGPLRR